MCEKCFVLEKLFEGAETSVHQNYLPTIAFIKEMIKQGRIELYAGDCQLDEIEKHLSEEKHYTINHYFKCSYCQKYFHVGACIRGCPIYKANLNFNEVDFKNILWGKCGSLFNS